MAGIFTADDADECGWDSNTENHNRKICQTNFRVRSEKCGTRFQVSPRTLAPPQSEFERVALPMDQGTHTSPRTLGTLTSP